MSFSVNAPAQQDLGELSRMLRRKTIQIAHAANCGHLGGAFSIIDIMAVLYFHFLKIDPAKPKMENRDRFILSKGHAANALYVTLAERGFFPQEELNNFLKNDSMLTGHPCSLTIPGVELSTGSLGHGLPVGIGMALASRLNKVDYRTVVLMSDGECDEGSVWEGIHAAAQWKLSSLTVIVDYNKVQSFGRTAEVMDLEPFADKWRACRWNVQEVNGHNHDEIIAALEKTKDSTMPNVIIAHTIKGKGVSFMEDTVDWHYWTPKDEHLKQALEELC